MRPLNGGGKIKFPAELSGVQLLIVLNVAVFILDALLRELRIMDLRPWLALSLPGLEHGFIWQVLTFQFMHAGLMHIFLNLLTLYFIGRILEAAIGKREFLKLYLISGACGGLFQIACCWIAPSHFGNALVVGASAGVFGVVGGFAALYPYQRLTLLIFFVIPFSMQAKTLIYIAGVVALWGMIFADGSSIAHAAHLGGMLTGIFILRKVSFNFYRYRFGFTGERRRHSSGSTPFTKTWGMGSQGYTIQGGAESDKSSGGNSPYPRSYPKPPVQDAQIIDDEPDEEFIRKRVDPILDKIFHHGIQSLTPEEREILEKAQRRMRKD